MGDNTSVAPSFRSSAPTSPGERPSPGSISLEFEDYPLDLVSSTRGAKPEPRGANGGRLSWHGANQYDYAYGAKRGFFENRYVENDIEPVRPLTNGNVCSYLDDLREFPRYKKERKLCSSCQMCCLRACSEDQPAPKRSPLPAWRQYIRDLFRWPPQGPMAQSITLLLGALLCWAILWSLYREKAAPGGGLFALLILVVLGHIAGQLLQCFRLPPLLGMMFVGCILRNVPSLNVAKDIDTSLASALRLFAMMVVLLRAGLALDPEALSRLLCIALRLAFMPCLFETLTVAVSSHILLDFPWIWSFMLGFLLSAVTPAIVVPCMLNLKEHGYGVKKGIPTLIIAAASVDEVLALTGFAVILGVNFSTGSLVWSVFRGPVEALIGLLYGGTMGLLLWLLPHKNHPRVAVYRGILLLGMGMFAMFGSQAAGIPGAGALGCITTPFVAALGWRRQGMDVDQNGVTCGLSMLWSLVEPVLFGLIGMEVDIAKLTGHTYGSNVSVVILGSIIRMIVSVMSIIGAKLSTWEKVFIPLAWLPKATVQAAIGSLALDTAIAQGGSEQEIELAKKMLAMAVLTILILAPVGSVLISLMGPLLLRHSIEPPRLTVSEVVEEEPTSVDRQELTWDGQLDFDTELTKMKVEFPVEITTERETVT